MAQFSSHLHIRYSSEFTALYIINTMKHYPSCVAGLTVVVLQSGDQISHPGVPVTLECSMGPGFSMSSYTLYWYRQNQYMAPIEFLTKEYDQDVGHFQSSINTSKNNFSLQISELFLNDSSTYYCAASHSDAHRPDSHTNKKSVTDGTLAGRSCGLFGSSVATVEQ